MDGDGMRVRQLVASKIMEICWCMLEQVNWHTPVPSLTCERFKAAKQIGKNTAKI